MEQGFDKCQNGDIVSSTGDVRLEDFIASSHLRVDCTTGDIKLVDCDADTLELECSTGSISGNILTQKTFEATSSTGRISVPNTSGPLCKVHTSTGDIDLTVG